jgi:hypothetical protein
VSTGMTVALKSLLKVALRRFNLRCIACKPLDEESVELHLVRTVKKAKSPKGATA